MVLSLKNVSKSYGENKILENVRLEMNEGNCLCLIGKNGSGKSTLINIIIDLIKADTGDISFWGENLFDPNSKVKKRIGVLPEFNPIIDEFSLQDYLDYVGLIYQVDKSILKQRSSYLIDYFFDAPPKKNKLIGEFSKGMKLKTGICAALIHKPDMIIFDEPFDGLDVFSANNLSAFLNDYVKNGNSVFLSSHDMLFIEKIATHVSLIKDSKVLNFSVSEFLKNGYSFEEHVSSILGYESKLIKPFE